MWISQGLNGDRILDPCNSLPQSVGQSQMTLDLRQCLFLWRVIGDFCNLRRHVVDPARAILAMPQPLLSASFTLPCLARRFQRRTQAFNYTGGLGLQYRGRWIFRRLVGLRTMGG